MPKLCQMYGWENRKVGILLGAKKKLGGKSAGGKTVVVIFAIRISSTETEIAAL